jgi:outer membrane lipoprotein-sorting protein
VSKLRIIIVLLLFAQAGCISVSRRRVVPAAERPLPAKTVSRADLLMGLEEKSKQIRTLQATVALDASGGALTTGVLTEYRQTKGFVIVDRPAHIRIKAQAPLALATVFDMVSDGKQYRVSIPIKNKFIVGNANTPGKEKNPILNLRPQHIVNALFVDVMPYVANSKVRSILEEAVEGRQSYYVFSFINVAEDTAQLIEKLWIDRSNLEVKRKQIFGIDGKVDTDVQYSEYQLQGDVAFPSVILIQRPTDDYSLKMTFQKTSVNEKLAADAFNLEQPPGAELVQQAEGSGTN